MKKLLSVILVLILVLSCSVSAFAAGSKDDSKAAVKTQSVKVVKDTADKTAEVPADYTAEEDAALEAAGVNREDVTYIHSYAETYVKGVPTAVRVEIGVAAERCSYLVEIGTCEIL